MAGQKGQIELVVGEGIEVFLPMAGLFDAGKQGWEGVLQSRVAGRAQRSAQAQRPCGVLAYGDVKRVELAIALANRPRLLLMDEPTAGMAPKERNELMALTKRLVLEKNMSVLFTEHSMDVVFAFADRMIVLARGQLIAEGDGETIRNHPKVQEVYFGSGKTFEKEGSPS